MKICVLDLETFWDTKHSLSKMSPIKYCMHPDTEIISCGFKFIDGKKERETKVIFGEQKILDFCKIIDWSQWVVVGHNLAGFDAMICSWRMGIKPKMWGCTLSMAAPIHAKTVGGSLAKLVTHYGLGVKDQTALTQTKGRHLKDFTKAEIEAMREYNKADVDQCWGLFKKLAKQTPKSEMRLIDMTIRMLVEPQFDCNTSLLYKTLVEEAERKEKVLDDLADIIRNDEAFRVAARIKADDHGFEDMSREETLKVLSSAAKFGKLLESLGATVPMKVSPTTGKEIPALAKSDEAFLKLLEHKNELVATAAAARLDAKSTLLQTRINAFLDAAQSHPDKKVPIPLKYYGALTTGRWSGWAYNPQNLPRINPYKPKPSDALRKSLMAPPGHKVVVADLSGIELRVNHFLWQVPSSMALYDADPGEADLYKDFASSLYEIGVDDVSKEQRQVGKVAHLGLGFGSGAKTFQVVAKLMGGVEMDSEESKDVVDAWRGKYPEIVKGWRDCHDSLRTILNKSEGKAIDPWGMIVPCAEGLRTPKGMIRYPKLRIEKNDDGRDEYIYGEGRHKARIYAGKVTENIVQHLARHVIAENAIDVQRELGIIPCLMVHDELVYIVPEDQAQSTLDTVQRIMRTPPKWWPELITWSEGDIADTYGDAK